MPPKCVACLHTAASNVALFNAASAGLDVELKHIVRADLLLAAEKAGGLTDAITGGTVAALVAAAAESDFVLLACSTLGPIADRFKSAVPMLRIDRALAEAAIGRGGRVVVLYTFPGTAQATGDLFREVAANGRAEIDMQLVPGAWDIFKAGDQARYGALIAAASDQAYDGGATSVAFAQASMTPAAAICRGPQPLTSPRASLLAAMAG